MTEIGVGLATTATVEQLLNTWLELSLLRVEISQRANARDEQWRDAADLDTKDGLWAEREVLWTEYRIISAWTEMIHSFHTFLVDGADSPHIDGMVFAIPFLSPPCGRGCGTR
jgi:hypothetical protein